LAAREILDQLLLVGSAESEAREIGARIELAGPDVDRVAALAHFLVDRTRAVEGAALIDVRDTHGVAHGERTGVGLFLAHDHPEERGLAGSVRPDHAYDPAARQAERQAVEQQR